MAQRHTVYLKHSAAGVTPGQVLASITDVEWDLVAEACGVPADRIGEADEHLRVEGDGSAGFRRYDLHYRAGSQRPVLVERWESPDIAAGVIEEVIDGLDPKNPAHRKARTFLEGCVDTVSASYGSARGEELAPVLASQVCLWLAQQFDGIIRDPGRDWYAPTDGLDLTPL